MIVAIAAQNMPANATVVNFGVSFFHLNETEKTEKPNAETKPNTKPIIELSLIFPKAIITIPIAAIIIASQTFNKSIKIVYNIGKFVYFIERDCIVDLQLKGRTALITGASKGIGAGLAKILATEGCNLHLAARDGKAMRDLSANLLSKFDILQYKYFFFMASILPILISLDIIYQYIFGFNTIGFKSFGVYNSGVFGNELIAGGFIKNFSFFSIIFSIFIFRKSPREYE